jgi:hypothetical protein
LQQLPFDTLRAAIWARAARFCTTRAAKFIGGPRTKRNFLHRQITRMRAQHLRNIYGTSTPHPLGSAKSPKLPQL